MYSCLSLFFVHSKLRAQLGLKPLLLDDHANTTAAMTTTSAEKKTSGNSSDSQVSFLTFVSKAYLKHRAAIVLNYFNNWSNPT